jgi:hypothetical protein
VYIANNTANNQLGCQIPSDVYLAALASSYRNLKAFMIPDTYNIGDIALVAFVKYCKHLLWLDLSGAVQAKTSVLYAFDLIRKHPEWAPELGHLELTKPTGYLDHKENEFMRSLLAMSKARPGLLIELVARMSVRVDREDTIVRRTALDHIFEDGESERYSYCVV